MATEPRTIPDETKARWLPMLEGGELKQAEGKLFNGSGYCCLGVYALACGAVMSQEELGKNDDGVIELADDFIVDIDGHDINDSELLEEGWAEQQGIDHYHQTFLSHCNDGGEAVVSNDDPLFAMYEKHGTVVPPGHGLLTVQAGSTKFLLKKHSFLEIATIIREDL